MQDVVQVLSKPQLLRKTEERYKKLPDLALKSITISSNNEHFKYVEIIERLGSNKNLIHKLKVNIYNGRYYINFKNCRIYIDDFK